MPTGTPSSVPPLPNGKNAMPLGTKGTFFQLTGKSVYDPAKFYTSGTDSKGHYERTRLRLTPSMQAMIEGFVAQIPEYATAEDFLRDAALHRVMWFQNNGIPTDEQALSRELHENELGAMRATMQAQDNYVTSCVTTVDMAVEVGNWGMLAEIITEMENQRDTGGYPDTIRQRLSSAIEDAWASMSSEISSRQKRRKLLDTELGS